MNKIILRAWNKDTKEMCWAGVFHKPLAHEYYFEIGSSGWLLKGGRTLEDENEVVCGDQNGILMQFTGQLDSRGIRIFAGDIVEIGQHKRQYEVYFEESAFMVKIYQYYKEISTPLCHYKMEEVTIVGNIYEGKKR